MEEKLREFEKEKMRQRMVNDELLNQLMKNEEKKQIFDRLLQLVQKLTVYQIKNRSDKTKDDVSHMINAKDVTS